MSKGSRTRRKKGRVSKATRETTPTPAEAASSSADAKAAAREADESASGFEESDFFSRGEEVASFPPSSLDTPELDFDDHPRRLRHTPELQERRARLRRWVTGVIAAAAVVTVMVSARALIAYAHPAPPADNSLSMSRPVVPSIAATDEPAAVAPAAAAPAAEPAIAASASSGGRPAFAASAAASARSAVPTPTKREARKLIERGRMKEGIVAARAAVGADPTDAETYLLLGAALQELGQWKESMAIFTQCVATATNGPVAECRALRGR